MKIAINALAARSRRHGMGRYITNLVEALAELDEDTEYVVFATRQTESFFRRLHSVEVQRVDMPVAARVVWEHTILPRRLPQLGIDVYFGPAHTVPIVKTTRQVVGILDMSWFTVGVHHKLLKRLYFKRMIPASIRRADVVVAISHSTAEDIENLVGTGTKPVIATPLGLDSAFTRSNATDVANTRRKYGLEQSPYIINVGVFEPRKNQEGIVRAYAQLLGEEPDTRHDLVLAGNIGYGWRKSRIWRLIEERSLSQRVKVIDSPSDDELRHLLTGADTFIYPSFYEGFGLPILEAMACGVPVITSNVSSMPEVGGDAACYVRPDNVAELSSALSRVLGDASTRACMSAAGKEQAARFTWADCARRTHDAFNVAIAE